MHCICNFDESFKKIVLSKYKSILLYTYCILLKFGKKSRKKISILTFPHPDATMALAVYLHAMYLQLWWKFRENSFLSKYQKYTAVYCIYCWKLVKSSGKNFYFDIFPHPDAAMALAVHLHGGWGQICCALEEAPSLCK